MQKFKLLFKEYRQIGPKTRHLVFTYPVDMDPMEFKAGQFISFHFNNAAGKEVRRNYSIADAPETAGSTIALACAYVENGLASEILFNLMPGDALDASGMYGIFVLKPETPKRYILVATGTGVTPYRSMLPKLQQLMQQNVPVVLLFGVRNAAELLYREDFVAIDSQYENFDFRACYSREQSGTPAAYEFSGHVQDQLADLAINPETDLAYLCGNPNMVDAVMLQLETLGLTRRQICREKYISGR